MSPSSKATASSGRGGGGMSSSSSSSVAQGHEHVKHRTEPLKGASYSTQLLLQMLCGAGAGAVTKTCIAPLERVKILLQLQAMQNSNKYKGLVGTVRMVLKEEGFLALWKGNSANVLRVIPVYALKFAFNDFFKNLARGGQDAASRPDSSLTTTELMIAGTTAGLFQQCVTYPLETIRTRLSLGVGFDLQYKGIVDCARSMVRTEGFTSFYKGITPTLLSGAPYVGLQMTCYDTIKKWIPKNEQGRTPLAWTIPAGAVAGLIAQTITYPGDTIRRRMQTNGANGRERIYSTSWDCCKKTFAKEGMQGFFNGLSTNIVRSVPGAGIQFMVYDALKRLVGLHST